MVENSNGNVVYLGQKMVFVISLIRSFVVSFFIKSYITVIWDHNKSIRFYSCTFSTFFQTTTGGGGWTGAVVWGFWGWFDGGGTGAFVYGCGAYSASYSIFMP